MGQRGSSTAAASDPDSGDAGSHESLNRKPKKKAPSDRGGVAEKKKGAEKPTANGAEKAATGKEEEKEEEQSDEDATEEQESHPELSTEEVDSMNGCHRAVTVVRYFYRNKTKSPQHLPAWAFGVTGLATMFAFQVFREILDLIFVDQWYVLGAEAVLFVGVLAYLLFQEDVARAFFNEEDRRRFGTLKGCRRCCSCCYRATYVARVWFRGREANFEEITLSTMFFASVAAFLAYETTADLILMLVTDVVLRIIITSSILLVLVLVLLSVRSVARALLTSAPDPENPNDGIIGTDKHPAPPPPGQAEFAKKKLHSRHPVMTRDGDEAQDLDHQEHKEPEANLLPARHSKPASPPASTPEGTVAIRILEPTPPSILPPVFVPSHPQPHAHATAPAERHAAEPPAQEKPEKRKSKRSEKEKRPKRSGAQKEASRGKRPSEEL